MTKSRTYAIMNSTQPDTSDTGRGVPNYLSSVAISPDNTFAWLPSKQDNMSRGTARDGLALTFDTRIRPVLSRIAMAPTGCSGSGSATVCTDDLANRLDLNDTEGPAAAELSPVGDLIFVATHGRNLVFVVNAYTNEVLAGIPTGLAPQGLALDGNGKLYVQNFMDRTVSIFDAAGMISGADTTVTLLSTVGTVASEPLSSQVLLGKKIFYNAGDPRMSRDGYLSCASCHLDGLEDGRVWDFTQAGEGFRNTITLQGRSGMGHGPVHWTGNFDEVQDFENDIRTGFGGTGFMSDSDFTATSSPLGVSKAGRSAELDALAAYVQSLTSIPRSPYRNADGTLSTNGAAGKTIFQGRNCTTCHVAPRFTDSALNVFQNVGTIRADGKSGARLGATLTGFDTPTLLGVWATPPYLHDGSAKTLYDVINNPSHGNASTLAAADKDKLVAYLKQMDAQEATGTGPLTLTTTPGGGQVALSWTAHSGTGITYTVQRSTTSGSGFANVTTGLTGTTHTDSGLTNGTTYYYKVLAMSGATQVNASNQSAATPSCSVPAAPTGVSATAGNAQVSVSWTQLTGLSYTVKRSTTSGSGFTNVASNLNAAAYNNTGLTNGTTYYYVVTAANGCGSSGNSTQVAATPAAVQRTALLVVGSPAAPEPSDDALKARLESNHGFAVTVLDDGAAVPSNVNSYDVVLIAQSSSSATLGAKYKNTTTGVVVGEYAVWDDMSMASGSLVGVSGQTQVNVVSSSSPLTSGIATGARGIFSTAHEVQTVATSGLAAAADIAVKHATNTNQTIVFGYAAGASMAGGFVAPGRRVGLGILEESAVSALTSTGWTLIDNAVSWASQ